MDVNILPAKTYDSAEWTSGIVTDYAVSLQALFVNVKLAKRVIIRVDQTITAKFNKSTNPAMTINANTSFEIDFAAFEVYITTSQATAIKIILLSDE